MTKLEFFFDCSSPWTYLAFAGIQPIAERYDVLIDWHPIIVGGVFNEVNKEVYGFREAMLKNERRRNYMMKDLADWARLRNLKIGMPDFHPVNSIKAMRGCIVAQEFGVLLPYATKVFEAYWGKLQDIHQDDVLVPIAESVGMSGETFLQQISEQPCKDTLRKNTEELVARGGYGAPTLYINKTDMYFGNDRLPLVEHKLKELALG